MSEQVRVEIVPCAVVSPEADQRAASDALRDLNAVRAVSQDAAEIADAEARYEAAAARLAPDAWSARINGVEFPVEAFGLEHVDGRVLVSLVVEADSFQVGDPPSSPQVRPADEKPPASTWGAPGRPDPRANIPGWKPEPGSIHLNPTVDFAPGAGDRIAGQVREHVRRTGGGSAVSV